MANKFGPFQTQLEFNSFDEEWTKITNYLKRWDLSRVRIVPNLRLLKKGESNDSRSN